MRWSSRLSRQADYRAAFAEVTEGVGAVDPDLVTLFVSPSFSRRYQDLAHLFQDRFPKATLLGCSADGLIGDGYEAEFVPGLAVALGWLPGVELHTFHLTQSQLPGPDAPPEAWQEMLDRPADDVRALILLVDPFSFKPEPLLSGLDYAYPRAVKVGGLVSGTQAPEMCGLFRGRSVKTRGMVGLALGGDCQVDCLVAQGCKPVGEPMVVTDCDRFLLREVDRTPTLEALTETVSALNESDQELVSRALFVGVGMGGPRLKYGPGDFLVRNVLGLEPKSGGLAVGAELRVGQTVQFHVRDRTTSSQDLERLLQELGCRPDGGLLFSCLGRGRSLYGEPDYDSSLVRGRFPDLPFAGFFCNGEIGPVGERTYLHGYTSCLVLVSSP